MNCLKNPSTRFFVLARSNWLGLIFFGLVCFDFYLVCFDFFIWSVLVRFGAIWFVWLGQTDSKANGLMLRPDVNLCRSLLWQHVNRRTIPKNMANLFHLLTSNFSGRPRPTQTHSMVMIILGRRTTVSTSGTRL